MKSLEHSLELLKSLQLRGIHQSLDELLHDAERQKHSHLNFLNVLLESELSYRRERRLQRNMSAAHFPVVKNFDDFEFGQVKGIGRSEAVNLLDNRWIDRRENILFLGPPGVGKTHLAIALGYRAVEAGYTVCFERMSHLIKLMKLSNIQRTAEYRLRKIQKSNVLIIDEIGYTPIDRNEANLFFSLISELYEKTSIILTSNKNFDNWAEMLGDSVMTTALLDRLLHHSKIFNLSGKSYRIKNHKKGGKVT